MVPGVRAFLLCFATVAAYRKVNKQHAGTKSIQPQQCGVKGSGEVNPLIINGSDADPCEWGWQVSLQAINPSTGVEGHSCGGVLIAEDWVLTAAHCVSSRAPSKIIAGVHDWANPTGEEQYLNASEVFVHPDWNWTGPGDIALLRLESPANFGSCVSPACLPSPEEDVPPGTTCWITGFGQTNNVTTRITILQEVAMKIVDQAQCIEMWDIAYGDSPPGQGPPMPTDGNICITSNGPEKGSACFGDSGGPLVCETSSGWKVFGVTSFGDSPLDFGGLCSARDLPNVYSSTYKYSQWIESIMGPL